jgi:hypothetical protein
MKVASMTESFLRWANFYRDLYIVLVSAIPNRLPRADAGRSGLAAG